MKRLALLTLLATLPLSLAAVDFVPKGDPMSDTPTAIELLDQADSVFRAGNNEQALELYQSTVETARKEFNRSVETEALAQCARCCLKIGQKEQGNDWLSRAGERGDDSDPMGWSRYLGVKGRFEWQENDLKAAYKTFNDMYDYCTANGLWGRSVDAAHMIAIVAEDPKEQIQWNYRGIESAEKNDEESWLGPLWNNLATVYYDLNNYDSALTCFIKAREYHWRNSGEVGKLFADYHIGMTYRHLGQNEEAAKWLRPVLAWAERLDHTSAIGQASEDLGEAYIALGKKAEGLKLLRQAREAYKKEKWDEQLPEIYQNLEKRIAVLEG